MFRLLCLKIPWHIKHFKLKESESTAEEQSLFSLSSHRLVTWKVPFPRWKGRPFFLKTHREKNLNKQPWCFSQLSTTESHPFINHFSLSLSLSSSNRTWKLVELLSFFGFLLSYKVSSVTQHLYQVNLFASFLLLTGSLSMNLGGGGIKKRHIIT